MARGESFSSGDQQQAELGIEKEQLNSESYDYHPEGTMTKGSAELVEKNNFLTSYSHFDPESGMFITR